MRDYGTRHRAWVDGAVRKIEADYTRSADTHLLHVAMPAVPRVALYLKDESTHPTGSLKHRLARSLFLYALVNGWIGPDTVIVEASSGSTAVSEAYFARRLGLRFIAVTPRSTSREKLAEIAFHGGEAHFVDSACEMYVESARLAAELGGHYMDQFTYAERATDWRGNNNIAQSIFSQMASEPCPVPAWIVVGAGTGGTSATLARHVRYKGLPTRIAGQTLALTGIKAQPGEFVGLTVMVLDGPGAGQYRVITANTPTEFTVERAWDVPPTTESTVGLWSLMRHMIIYKCEGYDCSAFAQLYGSYYDFTVDSCRVERNQGLWGQSGWFVRFCYNDVEFANSYHPGIGPHGDNPEGNLPFSFVGLTDGNLRITKFGSSQYGKKLVFVNDVTPHPVPGGRGVIVKGNTLRYNQRVAFPPSAEAKPRDDGKVRFVDVIVDGNRIEHSSAGVQIGPAARNVVLANNQFEDVVEPHLIAKPEQVQLLGTDAK